MSNDNVWNIGYGVVVNLEVLHFWPRTKAYMYHDVLEYSKIIHKICL